MGKEKSENNNYGLYIAIVAVVMIAGIGYYMNQKFNLQTVNNDQIRTILQNQNQRVNEVQNVIESNVNETTSSVEELRKKLNRMTKRLRNCENKLNGSKRAPEVEEDSDDESEDDLIKSRRSRR